MKKRLFLLAILLLASLSACADAPQVPAQQNEAPAAQTDTQPEAERSPAPEPVDAPALPEACLRWYDAALTGGAAERFASLPLAARADEGLSNDTGYSFRTPDGRDEQLVESAIADGVTLEEISDGGAARVSSYGQIVWGGEAYHALTIDADGCAIPNLRPNAGGGLLRLNVTGECTVDGGSEALACFEGFDCVLVTGTGTLRLTHTSGLGSGGGTLPLPALIVDGGASLVCDTMALRANEGCELTAAILDGTVCTQMLQAGGEVLVSGGLLLAQNVRETPAMVFRGGTALVDWLESDGVSLVLSGGEAYFANELPQNAVIEAGAGTLYAAELSGAQVHDSGALVLSGDEGGSRYYNTVYDAQWADKPGASWAPLTVREAGGAYFGGTLTLSDAEADALLAWGAMHLALNGNSRVTGELGATSLLLDGGEVLTAGAVNLWGWGGVRRPVFCLTGDTQLYAESVSMGSNAGETGTILIAGGVLSCSGELWAQNADVTVSAGAVTLGSLSVERGSITVTGGTLTLTDGLWLGEGDITVSGGEIVIPGGPDALCADNGSVTVTGGTVREP